jgi:tetratricopeptide (TPR) repeat protein
MYGIMPPAVAFEKARQVTEQALKLDPDFAFAHAQRGDIHRAYDWDWAAADRELKLALALAPNDGNISFYCLHRPHDPKAAVTRPLLSKWGSCLQRWPQSF